MHEPIDGGFDEGGREFFGVRCNTAFIRAFGYDYGLMTKRRRGEITDFVGERFGGGDKSRTELNENFSDAIGITLNSC